MSLPLLARLGYCSLRVLRVLRLVFLADATKLYYRACMAWVHFPVCFRFPHLGEVFPSRERFLLSRVWLPVEARVISGVDHRQGRRTSRQGQCPERHALAELTPHSSTMVSSSEVRSSASEAFIEALVPLSFSARMVRSFWSPMRLGAKAWIFFQGGAWVAKSPESVF